MKNNFECAGKQFNSQNHFIAYLDILGYKEIIKKPNGTMGLALCINKYIEDAKETARKYFSEKDNGSEIKLKAFSDNIMICTEKNWTILFAMIAVLQCRILVEDGIFIRGVLCVGELHIDKEFVCGQGIILAHEIESEIAIFPRVVIHDSFANAAKQQDNIPTATNTFEFLANLPNCSVDNDGYKYINYLLAACTMNNDEKKNSELLQQHREIIRTNLLSAGSERTKQKFQWCARYHNSIVEWFNSNGAKLSEQYLIHEVFL